MYLVGENVIAAYKTGEYIGEVVEVSGKKAAVKVLAVVKHPTQGDLHNPNQAHVGFFHQRRALANQEIALMPFDTISVYKQAVPEYRESLLRALERDKKALHNEILFAQKCLQELEDLEKDYFSE
ncbi:MAG: sporulation phosphorelay system protein KapB [Paenibacillaceae bacterium]